MIRNKNLAPVTPELETELRKILPVSAFPDQTAGYFEESRGRWKGHGFVLAPGSTQEVAEIVKACAQSCVPIIPYGGGTGLVGGQLVEDGIAGVRRVRADWWATGDQRGRHKYTALRQCAGDVFRT